MKNICKISLLSAWITEVASKKHHFLSLLANIGSGARDSGFVIRDKKSNADDKSQHLEPRTQHLTPVPLTRRNHHGKMGVYSLTVHRWPSFEHPHSGVSRLTVEC
jgi:hypothetical protein